MSKTPSTPTRVAADVASIAIAVAPTENRTFTEQVNHWARIGMQVERSGSLTNRRVLAAANGGEQFSALEGPERVAAHSLVDARITGRSAKERFGAAARVAGQRTVSVDDDGQLVEIAPDGTRRRL